MNVLEFVLILLVALFCGLLYLRSYQLERHHVRNRGIYQSPTRTAIKALRHWLRTIMTYVLPFYIVAILYFYLYTRHDCNRDPLTRAAYHTETVLDRAADALAWPTRLDEGPACPYTPN